MQQFCLLFKQKQEILICGCEMNVNVEIQNLIVDTKLFKNELVGLIQNHKFEKSTKNELVIHTFDIVFEHSNAISLLISEGMFATCMSVFRVQFDALVRQLWFLHAATDLQIDKLSTPLSKENFSALNNIVPSTKEMMEDLERKAPVGLNSKLKEFKQYSTKVLGSYVHTGVHALETKKNGFPVKILLQVLKQSNNLINMAFLGLAIQEKDEKLIYVAVNMHTKFPECFQVQ